MLLPLVALALAGPCSAFQLKNLVTFGDSYTDNTMNGDGNYSTDSS
jgi:phospholipase/lecithinase/hemolysin